MLITKKTKTKHILPLLSDAAIVEQLLDKIEPYPLDKDIIEMTIAEFASIVDDDEEYVKGLLKEKYAYKAFGKLKSYQQQMKSLNSWLKRLEIQQTSEEKQASLGVEFPSMIERMLLTVTEFFHLTSFEEAEKVKLSNYLLIAKDKVADTKYQRNYQKILDTKSKMNRKR